jgi:Inner membrane protein YgaP-like, transmembrane domain
MTRNEGMLDRIVRVVAGVALIASPLGLYGADYASVWGWIGVVPLVTGLVGVCPAYSLVGIKTCSS